MKRERMFNNPFKPGAGHLPPYLAGRDGEVREFDRLLNQETILENLILTGLRGVGKTVLLDTMKLTAQSRRWSWIGTDMSESSSATEESLAIRLLTDLSIVTSSIIVRNEPQQKIGFSSAQQDPVSRLGYEALIDEFIRSPGLTEDKIKGVLEMIWEAFPKDGPKGIVFAYDEAQNLGDHPGNHEYPLSMLLSVFQSIQRKNIPFMLVLTGLPTLYPKLLGARTFTERMFRVLTIDRLSEKDIRDAITKPLRAEGCPIQFSEQTVRTISELSGGYPYFIQFISREVFDSLLLKDTSQDETEVPVAEILNKLDMNFYAGRWMRITDRQRDLLRVIAKLDTCESEFTIRQILLQAKKDLKSPISASQINQMLAKLAEEGIVYKNRRGKYSFAVPMLNRFISRQLDV